MEKVGEKLAFRVNFVGLCDEARQVLLQFCVRRVKHLISSRFRRFRQKVRFYRNLEINREKVRNRRDEDGFRMSGEILMR